MSQEYKKYYRVYKKKKKLILDVNKLAKNKNYYDISAIFPSKDHRYLAYGEDVNGNELNYYNTSSLDSNTLFLKYRHKHVAKLDLEYRKGSWSYGTSLRYNSFMLNVDKIFVDPLFESLVPGISQSRQALDNGDFIVDFRVIYNLNRAASVSLLINNLVNSEYQTRPANMMAPRSISLKLGISI